MISFCVSGTRGAWRFCLRGRKIHTKIGSRKRESREGIALEELDLKYLQYALAVVRYGSVTQAARALYLAQPNLSRAIGELEQSLGFPLFLRTRQGMSLTPQGERVPDGGGDAAGPAFRPGAGVPSGEPAPGPLCLCPLLPVCQHGAGDGPGPAGLVHPV